LVRKERSKSQRRGRERLSRTTYRVRDRARGETNDELRSVGNSTVCGKALGIGAGNVHYIGKGGVREELGNKVRVMIGEVLVDIKRRDFMGLNFNELVHMVFASKGGHVGREKNYAKIHVR